MHREGMTGLRWLHMQRGMMQFDIQYQEVRNRIGEAWMSDRAAPWP